MTSSERPMSSPRQLLVRRLLRWYRRWRRDLPWRGDPDPYRIWVSEVMLQQTRVEAARPYYERFVREFPRLRDLARAPLDRVLARWAGLGYYDRARSLHRAVRECESRYQGRVPRDPEAFGGLPGVGPYTRAAVLSIAFGTPLAVVDGNVIRVLARLFTLPGRARSPGLRRRVGELATELLPRRAAGDFNQALMELGAVLCTPRSPRCEACPVRETCQGRRRGHPERWPARGAPKAVREVRWEAALVRRGSKVLLLRRGEGGRFKGMWELPWTRGELAGTARIGPVRLRAGRELARVRHAVLDERITAVLREARLLGGGSGERVAWVAPGDLGSLAVSSVWRKLLAGVLDPAA